MRETAEDLRHKLSLFGTILENRPLFSISREEKNRFRSEADVLLKKVDALQENCLVLGLLGGTGVGKSTLMNALAGEEISSTSHRRPHTDHILIYRHHDVKLPRSINLKNLPSREIAHKVEGIQHIILCDLPDFDSLLGEHEEQVRVFLENLDVLIWVASPEKYSDKRFYDFLKSVPKSKKNFIFVLNKADLLFEEQAMEEGYGRMRRVSGRFEKHVRENDVPDPVFYVVSAQEALFDSISPWNQFLHFRQQIFQQRDVKQIGAIKAANLDVEVHLLLGVLEEEMRSLDRFEKILDQSLEEIQEQRSDWNESGTNAVTWWTETYMRKKRVLIENLPSILLGPGYGLALLAGLMENRSKSGEGKFDKNMLGPPEEVSVAFQARVDWIKERVKSRLLRENLSNVFYRRFEERACFLNAFSKWAEESLQIMEGHLDRPSMPAFRMFKARQYATYFTLLLIFVAAIVDKADWHHFLNSPGLNSLFHMAVSGIHTLFSGKGLAALLSYALLNLFFAFRFYRLHRKQLRRMNRKMMHKLKNDLISSWNRRLEFILSDLERFREEIQQRISVFNHLRTPGDGS